jgi:hypothetical protein
MSCPGLHCPGCSGRQSLGIAAATIAVLVAAETAEYVAERIWWISSTAAACYVLAVAAGMWLERRNDRKAAAWGAARGIYSRADVILPYPVRAEAVTSSSTHPAIGPAVVHLHFHGVPAAEQAAIIRQAIPGHAGAAITSPEH